jgi:transcriptional regulator with XRE-family HTH domain
MDTLFKPQRQKLANNVKSLRKQLSWSQEQLAELANLDRTYISAIERAQGNPSLESLLKLANALDVRVGQLLDGRL